MFYKNWPYWLKGGIAFGVIGLAYSGVGFLMYSISYSWDKLITLWITLIPMMFIDNFLGLDIFQYTPLQQYIFQVLVFFLAGVIMGILVALIKKITKKVNK
jgi:hypothetical protein